MKKVIMTIVLCLVVFGLGYFYAVKTVQSDVIENMTILYDTLYVETKPLTLWKTAYINVVQNDTTIITNIDTIFIEKDLKIASDTVEFKEGWLGVEYYYIPINKFCYDWKPIDIPVIYTTTTITVVKKPKWYLKKEVWLLGGIVSGILLTK
uniref:Uncharacterized protein n=1 Tax=viral metagenome TaxID=1070528 RepID=A0A6M3XK29_9ZZZZ